MPMPLQYVQDKSEKPGHVFRLLNRGTGTNVPFNPLGHIYSRFF